MERRVVILPKGKSEYYPVGVPIPNIGNSISIDGETHEVYAIKHIPNHPIIGMVTILLICTRDWAGDFPKEDSLKTRMPDFLDKIKQVSERGLDFEVITSANVYLQDHKEVTLLDALEFGISEWVK